MAKEQAIKVEGVVLTVNPGPTFLVEVNENHQVVASLSGKMRKHHIKILPGDIVAVEVSPYDLTRGRVTYRNRG